MIVLASRMARLHNVHSDSRRLTDAQKLKSIRTRKLINEACTCSISPKSARCVATDNLLPPRKPGTQWKYQNDYHQYDIHTNGWMIEPADGSIPMWEWKVGSLEGRVRHMQWDGDWVCKEGTSLQCCSWVIKTAHAPSNYCKNLISNNLRHNWVSIPFLPLPSKDLDLFLRSSVIIDVVKYSQYQLDVDKIGLLCRVDQGGQSL